MELRKRNVHHFTQEQEEALSSRQKMINAMKTLDVYPKLQEDFAHYTKTGGITTIVSLLIICMLFVNELVSFISVRTTEHIQVDTNADEVLQMHFNITFFKLQCSVCHLDVVDKSGEMLLDVAENIKKQRLSRSGTPLGDLYSDTDTDIPDDNYGEGCEIAGILEINRVAGNWHIAIGASRQRNMKQHIHSFKYSDTQFFNATHRINQFAFGSVYPGMVNPLDGVTKASAGIAHYAYLIQVVPTIYQDQYMNTVETNQYSFTEYTYILRSYDRLTEQNIPGINAMLSCNVIGDYGYVE